MPWRSTGAGRRDVTDDTDDHVAGGIDPIPRAGGGWNRRAGLPLDPDDLGRFTRGTLIERSGRGSFTTSLSGPGTGLRAPRATPVPMRTPGLVHLAPYPVYRDSFSSRWSLTATPWRLRRPRVRRTPWLGPRRSAWHARDAGNRLACARILALLEDTRGMVQEARSDLPLCSLRAQRHRTPRCLRRMSTSTVEVAQRRLRPR
jgi:hypothetical protein